MRWRSTVGGGGGQGRASPEPNVDDAARRPATASTFRIYQLERLRGRGAIRKSLGIAYIACSLVYLVWRLTVFNPEAPIFSTIFYLGEAIGFILAVSLIVIAWRYRYRKPVPAPPGLKVDILVPTYNENAEMVRRTALAAMHVRYPHETWLLDDGNRPAIKAIAEELGCHYIARTQPTQAKPGNLNNALRYASGDFVAVLDADFVAQINFLDCLLGYFSDPAVAFVQAPQGYYNVTAYQYRTENHEQFLWHDEGPFYDVLQPGRDSRNATTSCGTAVVYRRSAIDEIGGFATETVTEDMHTAIRLHKRGHKSVFYPEPVAFGVAPNDLAEYYKTRHRWGQGNIQSLRCERVPFSRGLTLMQRICYLQLGTLYLEGWQRLVLYFAPAFTLITGLYPVDNTAYFFWFFIPYIVLDYLCFEETLRGYGRVYLNEQLCMSRFGIYILATFAVFYDYPRWRVSSKKIAGELPASLLLPQAAVLALNLTGLGFGIWTIAEGGNGVVPAWVTGFVCLFAALYSLLACLVIKEAIKRARYRRTDYRFDIPLPVRFDVAARDVYGTVSSISTHGMTVVSPNKAAIDGSAFALASSASDQRAHPNSEPRPPLASLGSAAGVRGHIYLPNGPVNFTATMEPPEDVIQARGRKLRRNELALIFDWSSQSDKDRLDLTLHACGWHRRFVHPTLYLKTPIEWVQEKLLRQLPPVPQERWKYVLCRRDHDDEGRWFLAVVQISDDGGPPRLVAFEDIAMGAALTMLTPDDPNAREQKIVVVARGPAPAPAESDIEGAAMIEYRFAWVHHVAAAATVRAAPSELVGAAPVA